jgi:hypothetical protein
MTTNPLTRNITATFRAASPEDRVNGRDWYQRARTLAEYLASTYEPADGEDSWAPGAVERAAGVIAALSPRLAWRKNVEYAKMAYRLFYSTPGVKHPLQSQAVFLQSIPTLKANALKAFRILSGEESDDVLGGPKVRAFYFTIVNPSDPRAVVVDRHAVDVAFGEVLDDARRGVALGRKGAYDSVSALYRRAAVVISRETGQEWTPAEIQATTWTYWRRERAAAYHGEA